MRLQINALHGGGKFPEITMQRAPTPTTTGGPSVLPRATAFYFRQYSYDTGFQGEVQSETALPESHAMFESLVADPLFHVACAGPILRQKVGQMPLVDSFDNLTLDEKRRAFKILSMVSHAFIWGDGRMEVLQCLPPQLAIPLHILGNEFGMAPLATYATTVLWNCSLIDTAQGWAPNNVAVDLTFTGTSDEKLFYSVSACIEVAGAEALNSLISVASSISSARTTGINPDHSLLDTRLGKARTALSHMVSLLFEVLKMDSEVFYWKMRPYFAGWALVHSTGAEPRVGVHYDGVDQPDETRQYVGISAAQSSLFQCIDLLLSVEHGRERSTMLRNARAHMPRDHREMVEKVESSYNGIIKAYVEASPPFVDTYNGVMDQVLKFRRVHLAAAKKFAVREAGRPGKTAFGLAKDIGGGGGAIGAGGSQLEPFLMGLVENTRLARVSVLL